MAEQRKPQRTRPVVSPWFHAKAAESLAALRAALLADDPSISDDPLLLRDLLDAEGDGIDILRRILLASIQCGLEAAEAKAAGSVYKSHIAALNERADRRERDRERLRAVAADLMDIAGLPRFPEPEFNAYFAQGQSFLATAPDPAKLPDDYVEITRTVRVDKLLADLRAGVEVDGAPPLTNPRPHLVIRIK